MKMISNTSMTSTIGVTLISAITGRAAMPPLAEHAGMRAAPLIPMQEGPQPTTRVISPAPLVDLPRQDRGEFVGEALQALGLTCSPR